ncbi:MAG: hypothetical protein ACXWQZ_25000 [Ktedonobacterales bacterium]
MADDMSFIPPGYEEYYGRSWVPAVPSHMPGYFETTPQDGPGNQVFPVSLPEPYQLDIAGYASALVPRSEGGIGPLMSQVPSGLSGNAQNSAQYRNLRAARWTDNLDPHAQ